MPSSSVIAKRYFAALSSRDLESASACWAPGAGEQAIARHRTLLAAFPDLWLEVLDTTTQRERCVVRWRMLGTFIGPGRLDGFAPNGGSISIEGIDVLEVADDLIVGADSFLDGAELLRQLGLIPSGNQLPAIVNARTWTQKILYGAEPEAIAAGVWVLRGGRPRLFNVFLIEGPDGLTVFDTGPVQMTDAIKVAGVRFGGIERVILSHADSPHRGGAAALGAPVHCHPLERGAAEGPSSYRDYWNLGLLSGWSRPLLTRLLSHWDGGGVKIAGTVEEGDQVAGFVVLNLPGHAPGLIGLWRAEDGLALVSDAVFTVNPETGFSTEPQVAPAGLSLDTEQARESIRMLASLNPRVVWTGYGRPLSGDDAVLKLQQAAAAAV
jgi:glyoxylase-like metal-dependent hydrolase (beta-lactamase superfamily II)